MNIAFLAPHLSTGGMPQYLLWEVRELLQKGNTVMVVEWSNIAGEFNVQRKQLENLLGSRLVTLPEENKVESFENELRSFNPEVVHLQEAPELWLDFEVASKIYKKDRPYKIVETSHDSEFDVANKVFLPDSFGFISNYHPQKYALFGIPYEIIEYPIVIQQRPSREAALKELGLDAAKKHVLNVGLFTPRKNQAEIFEVAKRLKDFPVEFHFVGNQAGNFKFYWEGLLADRPDNCTIWGEQEDVGKFYGAMDLFYFASQGFKGDRETNPLVLKEALGWQLPVIMYNLDAYCGAFDKEELVSFIDSDLEKTVDLLVTRLGLESVLNESVFEFSYQPKENKITILYKGSSKGMVDVAIRDIDTHLSMWTFDMNLSPGNQIWVIPIPEHRINFAKCVTFNGFRIEFYKDKKELLFIHELRIRSGESVCKINLNSKPFDLPFYNFMEFFHANVYGELPITKDSVVVDIGANGGVFVAYMLSLGARHVIAVEPGKAALENLRASFEHDKRVTIIPFAMHSLVGSKTLYSIEGNSTMSSFENDRLNKEYTEWNHYEVEVETIDFKTLWDKCSPDRVDLLKFDIEGAEYAVIESVKYEDFARVKNILVEFHANQGRLVGTLKKLTELGFEYELTTQDGVITEDLDRPQGCILARRLS